MPSMSSLPRLTASFLLLAVVSAQGVLADNDDKAGQVFFEKKIRPVLARYCYECHGKEKQESDLRLDNYKDLLRGGGTGPAVVPNNLDESLIIHVLKYEDEELHMPPEQKLSDEIIEDFVKWIEAGAADSRLVAKSEAERLEKAKSHWAFQPIKKPAVPAVKNPWIRNVIDSFILNQATSRRSATFAGSRSTNSDSPPLFGFNWLASHSSTGTSISG